MQRAKRPVLATVLASSLLLAGMAPLTASADDMNGDRPSEMAMMGDVLVARPLLLASTAVGLVTYTLTLPFSVLGGNEKEAAQKLVVAPARATFLRCLGCTPAQDENLRMEKAIKKANKNNDSE